MNIVSYDSRKSLGSVRKETCCVELLSSAALVQLLGRFNEVGTKDK